MLLLFRTWPDCIYRWQTVSSMYGEPIPSTRLVLYYPHIPSRTIGNLAKCELAKWKNLAYIRHLNCVLDRSGSIAITILHNLAKFQRFLGIWFRLISVVGEPLQEVRATTAKATRSFGSVRLRDTMACIRSTGLSSSGCTSMYAGFVSYLPA